MKNLMVYVVEDPRADLGRVRRHLDAQVDNSLDLGWDRRDILLLTNFPHRYQDVDAIQVPAARRPPTARLTSFHKTRCILAALELVDADEVVWYHDVDAFQVETFDGPPSDRPLSFCLYSTRERLLVQGGSMFFSAAARPVFEEVFDRLVHHRCRKDEFALTDVVNLPAFNGWFEVLDFSYNLGATDFEFRYQLAAKSIKVIHFHVERPEHRALFMAGRNALGVSPVDERLRGLLERHGFDTSCPAIDGALGFRTLPRYGTTNPILRQIQRALSIVI